MPVTRTETQHKTHHDRTSQRQGTEHDPPESGLFPSVFIQIHVGMTRLERATPWSQTKCATNCATSREPQRYEKNLAYFRKPSIFAFPVAMKMVPHRWQQAAPAASEGQAGSARATAGRSKGSGAKPSRTIPKAAPAASEGQAGSARATAGRSEGSGALAPVNKVRWVSGLNHQFAKLTYGQPYRGFESPPHR